MERKPTFTTICFFLILILIPPYFSRGERRSEALIYDSGLYEIDYRGPETHSSVPPPDHSPAKSHSPHRKSSDGAPKTTDLKASSGRKG